METSTQVCTVVNAGRNPLTGLAWAPEAPHLLATASSGDGVVNLFDVRIGRWLHGCCRAKGGF
jgi:hypothetical protein